MRGWVTITSAEPTRNVSPTLICVSSKPVVVKVFAEHAPGQIHLWQLALPKIVMLGRIDIDGLLRPAVNRQIRLPIAIEIERAEIDSSGNRLFKDAGRDWFVVAQNQLRQPHVERNDFHFILSDRNVLATVTQHPAHPDQLAKKPVDALDMRRFIKNFPVGVEQLLRPGKIAIPEDGDQTQLS